jgi:hypothetical protein
VPGQRSRLPSAGRPRGRSAVVGSTPSSSASTCPKQRRRYDDEPSRELITGCGCVTGCACRPMLRRWCACTGCSSMAISTGIGWPSPDRPFHLPSPSQQGCGLRGDHPDFSLGPRWTTSSPTSTASGSRRDWWVGPAGPDRYWPRHRSPVKSPLAPMNASTSAGGGHEQAEFGAALARAAELAGEGDLTAAVRPVGWLCLQRRRDRRARAQASSRRPTVEPARPRSAPSRSRADGVEVKRCRSRRPSTVAHPGSRAPTLSGA